MRFIVFLLASFFIFYSCAKQPEDKEQKVVEIYSKGDFFTKVKIIDTACINQTKRAYENIKKNKLSFNSYFLYHRQGYSVKSYFNEKDIFKELIKYNIHKDTALMAISDLRVTIDNLFKEYCYQHTMNEEVNTILGHGFLDSLIHQTERNFVINHPDKIFSLQDRDFYHIGPAEDFNDFGTKSKVVFKENFIYPKGYKPKNERSFSYTSAHFVLMKNGAIKDLVVVSTFQNPDNNKFKDYFENELKQFVLNTKWVHPVYSGLITNSEMHFTFHHK